MRSIAFTGHVCTLSATARPGGGVGLCRSPFWDRSKSATGLNVARLEVWEGEGRKKLGLLLFIRCHLLIERAAKGAVEMWFYRLLSLSGARLPFPLCY